MLTGGVSVGKYDRVEGVLREIGAEFFFDAVAIRPGKPAVFGWCQGKPVFGLPGNPVSTMVTFELFVVPAIEMLSGHSPHPLPFFKAKLAIRSTKKPASAFPPRAVQWSNGDPTVEVKLWEGSGDIGAVVRANCFLVVHVPSAPGGGRVGGRAPPPRGILAARFLPSKFRDEETIPLRRCGPRADGGRHREAGNLAHGAAHAFVRMKRATVASLRRLKSPKGNPLEIARIAGITAAKRTSELIPFVIPWH